MPGVREQEGTASKDSCHNDFDFFIYKFHFNRKLENKKHFLDMPAVNKSWSRRKIFTRAEDSNSTRINGLSAFLD